MRLLFPAGAAAGAAAGALTEGAGAAGMEGLKALACEELPIMLANNACCSGLSPLKSAINSPILSLQSAVYEYYLKLLLSV